jgi:hypothetical protein
MAAARMNHERQRDHRETEDHGTQGILDAGDGTHAVS